MTSQCVPQDRGTSTSAVSGASCMILPAKMAMKAMKITQR